MELFVNAKAVADDFGPAEMATDKESMISVSAPTVLSYLNSDMPCTGTRSSLPG